MTLDRYLYFCDHPVGAGAKKQLRRWRTVNTVFLVLMPIAFLFSALAGQQTASGLFVFFTLVFAYKLFCQRKAANSKQYKKIRQAQTTEDWIRTASFSDVIRLRDANSESVYHYGDFRTFSEADGCFYLWRDADLVVRLPRDCFTVGSAEDFPAFIREKMAEAGAEASQ
jgi:hypothetical protein